MAKTEQWNSPEYVAAFDAWRIGEAGLAAMDLLEAEAAPHHLLELHAAKGALWERLGTKPEHRFSDNAIHSVRQDPEAYLSTPSIPKYQLAHASMVRQPEGTRFSRMYDTRLTLEDVLRSAKMSEDDLYALMRVGPSHSTEQRVDALYDNIERAPGGAVSRRFPPRADLPKGRTEDFPPAVTVADYITLGHLIQHDLNA